MKVQIVPAKAFVNDAHGVRTIDHLEDYVRWYSESYNPRDRSQGCVRYTHVLMDFTIETKIWYNMELHDWLNQNCQQNVYVQRENNGWLLCFPEKSDYEAFLNWWNSKKLGYEFDLIIQDEVEHKRLYEWLIENTVFKFRTTRYTSSHRTVVAFQSQEEAALFRISWK